MKNFIKSGLCCFTIHDPSIHNSCVNYQNKAELCGENLTTVKTRFYRTKD